MSAPRTKRQFAGAASDPNQRQITSFFSKTTSLPDYSSGPLSPPLPGAVQANLISVGMRVRKSVPEGYKTGHKFGGFSLWADNSTSLSSSATPSPPSCPRELLPFCGINKVGGLAVQPETAAPMPASFFTSSALDNNTPAISISPAVPELDDLPGLTSSQDSVTSTTSTASSSDHPQPYLQPHSSPLNKHPNTKKRLYTDDTSTTTSSTLPLPIPSETNLWRDRRDWDGQVSPRSLAPAGWEKNARVMAVPRGVRKPAAPATRQLDQENRVVVAVAGDEDDFEEAEFLDYMEVEN